VFVSRVSHRASKVEFVVSAVVAKRITAVANRRREHVRLAVKRTGPSRFVVTGHLSHGRWRITVSYVAAASYEAHRPTYRRVTIN
jgi:hypothetical protein